MEPLCIGTGGSFTVYICVERDEKPYLRLNVHSSDQEYHFRERLVFWNDLLAVGIGEGVSLVLLEEKRANSVSLDSYFGEFYTVPGALLAASAERVFRFSQNGELIWRSPQVGLDGVVIAKVEGGVVYGDGEYDPPGGWRPFQISLQTGEYCSG